MNSALNRIDIQQASDILQQVLSTEILPKPDPTHFVAHDLRRMRGRIENLIQAFPSSCLHAIAIKANPLVEVLRAAVATGAGLEAASIEEVYLALAAGCPCRKIVFDSPAKTNSEIEEALRLGVLLNANSFPELKRIDECLRQVTSKSQIGLRINPEIGGGSIAATSVARAGGKFGVSISRTDEILAAFATYSWLTGLHCHVGSQGCECSMLVKAVHCVFEFVETIRDSIDREIQFVDIGGGLPTAYTEDQTAPTYEEYAGQLKADVRELFDSDITLVTEYGRSIQAGCGIAFSQVEYISDDSSVDQQMAVVHFGADFLLRPVYRSEDWRHEFFVLDGDGNPKVGRDRCTTIAGPLCFGGDIIGQDVWLPTIRPGDWLCIRDVGAYTLSMWSRHCSRGLPPVVGVDGEESPRLLYAGETPDDVVRFWSDKSVAISGV